MRSKVRNVLGEMLTIHTPKIPMTKTRKTLVRLFLTGLASVPPLLGLTVQAQSSITNGLVAYWNFDAQDFKDSVGTFDGTQNGSNPIAFVAGKPGFGQAIQLDGVDQFVEITGRDATYDPDQLAFEAGSISVAGWFTVGTFDKSWQALIAKGEGNNWRVHRNGANSTMAYAGGIGEGPNDGPDVTDGNWHHFVAVSDANAVSFGTAIYIDGVQTSVNATAPALATNAKNMKIGDNPDATGRYWNGKVDDLAIWTRVLTEAEISTLYAAGAGKEIKSFFGPPVFGIGPPSGSTAGFTIAVFDAPPVVADTNTIVLNFNGAPVTPTSVTKANGITTIAYNVPNPPLASRSTNTTSLTIKDTTGAVHSSDGSFVVPAYATLPPSLAVTGVDTTKPGFRVKPYQVASGQPNTIGWTEEELLGVHGTNIANLTQTIDGKPIGADGYFIITNVINWDEVSLTQSDGNFRDANGYPEIEIPGMPAGAAAGDTTDYDNSAAEVLTFVQFPTGGVIYTMGVNSDDGFRVSAGQNSKDAFQSLTLGSFEGGRGAFDTTFKIYVPTAGIYPVRLLWEDGGSGANCEWFTVQPDKTKILLNDPSPTNTTGIKAFYSGPATTTPAYVVSFSHSLGGGTLRLADGSTQVTVGSVKLYLNGAAVPTTGGKTNGVTTANYSLATPLPSGSTVALIVVYNDNTSATITNGTTFVAETFTGVTKDVLRGINGYIRGKTAGFTPDAGGHSGTPGDYAIDSTSKGGTWVDIQDVSFINPAAANDTLSMAMWIKKYDIAAGSAFWAADASGARVFQAHVPWNDDNIYFDTAGGATAGTQRISDTYQLAPLCLHEETGPEKHLHRR